MLVKHTQHCAVTTIFVFLYVAAADDDAGCYRFDGGGGAAVVVDDPPRLSPLRRLVLHFERLSVYNM